MQWQGSGEWQCPATLHADKTNQRGNAMHSGKRKLVTEIQPFMFKLNIFFSKSKIKIIRTTKHIDSKRAMQD